MSTDTSARPTGTGQAGAGTPAGVNKDIPIHIEGEPHEQVNEVAGHAARKGFERQQREDPTEFTK